MNAEDLAAILDELGRRLGPAGEYVFRLAVQRQIVGGLMGVAVGGLLAVGCAVAGVALWRYATADNQNSYSDRGVGGVIGGGAFLIVGLFGLAMVYGGVLSLLTPEYSALRDILSAINPGGSR